MKTLARRFWPNQDPIGKQLIVARAELHEEVVGVVADVKTSTLDSEAGGELYSPYSQRPWPGMNIEAKTTGNPMLLAGAVRKKIAQVDGELPLRRSAAWKTLWGFVCAAAAHFVAAGRVRGGRAGRWRPIGTYGLLANSVEQRRQEMGIRRALGARPADILQLVLREGLGLTAVGIAVGLTGALAASRALSALLFRTSPNDP